VINLDAAITSSQTTIVLERFFTTAEFPEAGVVLIDTEEIHYSGIAGDRLTGCTRGFNSTSAAAHAKDAEVTLVTTDVSVTPITRLSEDQRDRIVPPVAGMLIYNTTSDKLNVYTGSDWEIVTSV